MMKYIHFIGSLVLLWVTPGCEYLGVPALTYRGACEAVGSEPESCDGLDNDCDGEIDEGDVLTDFYPDGDEDGYGADQESTQACEAPKGYVENDDDCNDTATGINPDATETCDSVDNNCNGSVDEGVTTTYYADEDRDDYGDPAQPFTSCKQPIGYVTDSSDCDDKDSSTNPAAPERCDNNRDDNCNSLEDEDLEEPLYQDSDGDGFGDAAFQRTTCLNGDGWVGNSEDCDDIDPKTFPGAPEFCDGIDNNCDQNTDEGYDIDEDGYLDIKRCLSDASATDCEDNNSNINPDETEQCNGVDDNCDEVVDNGFDEDGDGYLAAGKCSGEQLDCDDLDDSIHPNAWESCDQKDTNCDGALLDNEIDHDGDGYASCQGDCDPGNAEIYPGATEGPSLDDDGTLKGDGVDNNCDGKTDEGTGCFDDDGDGYIEFPLHSYYCAYGAYGADGKKVDPDPTTGLIPTNQSLRGGGDFDDGDGKISPDLSPYLVYIPAGPFVMGTSAGGGTTPGWYAEVPGNEACASQPDEFPTVNQAVEAMAIQRYEVRVSDFVVFLNDTCVINSTDPLSASCDPDDDAQTAEVEIDIQEDEGNNPWFNVMQGGNVDTSALQFAAVPNGSGYKWKTDAGQSQYPIMRVTQDAASAYCQWLGDQQGGEWTGTLPTEVQWEKAARGGCEMRGDPSCHESEDAVLYAFQDEPNDSTPTCDQAWGYGCSSQTNAPDLVDIATLEEGASIYGIEGTMGNVWEWTSSLYTCGPEPTSNNDYVVIRGGGRESSDFDMRTSNRHPQDRYTAQYKNSGGSTSDDVIGFRCVLTK